MGKSKRTKKPGEVRARRCKKCNEILTKNWLYCDTCKKIISVEYMYADPTSDYTMNYPGFE